MKHLNNAGAEFDPGLPGYEVYALRYATVDRPRRDNFLAGSDSHDAPMPLDYFVWIVRHGQRIWLVDTGFNREAAEARKRVFLRCPVESMSLLGLGLQLYLIGGHTDGLQVVRVHTQRGWIVLASDASHFYENMDRKAPFPVVYHVGDMVAGWEKISRLVPSAQHVVPGHDPDVLRRYPAHAVQPGPAGVEIVCLHEVPSR